ncbi:MAG: hypothetical protein VYD14_07835 [SAR324 cluster bacterium]|jgi:hypothetical protein|nr:hypothetical protein [SAR324 cluster bacterium]MEC8980199.1 hypothetical protein [SAR324 cluster bacterium]MEC9461104.1 hypothetical protein [SAR324 cluster bacterium]MED5402858.1 hypothetical protein [SAR324 cluster bacterium]
MVTENDVSLQVDLQRRIGVTDVINMLKGLRSEAEIKIVKSTEPNENKVDTEQSQSVISATDKFNQSSTVKGNTDLPQIRELNEIAAMLRSMDGQQNHFGS